MSEVATAIGVISGVMGIWQFIADMIPDPETLASNYRVHIGLNGFLGGGGELSNADGEIDLVKTYNINHELIGAGSGGKIGDGDYQYGDFSVEQHGNQQSIWTEFFAGNDAICIAAISATMDEGTQWGWTGDWGYFCGLNWYQSGYKMQNDKNQADASPKCTWIDKDHTNGMKAAIIGINWSELRAPEGGAPTRADAEKQCGKNMQAWHEDGGLQMLPIKRSKRHARRQSQRSDDRLIVSNLVHHNATELCLSETSWGPDFVSIANGVYCNMHTHETMPLCDSNIRQGCFDLHNADGPRSIRRESKVISRKPSRIINWD